MAAASVGRAAGRVMAAPAMDRLAAFVVVSALLPTVQGGGSGPPIFHQRIDAVPLMISLSILVLATILIELLFRKLKRAVEHDLFMQNVVEKVVEELMILGVLSFLTLFVVQFSESDSHVKTKYIVEWEVAHVWLFAMGLSLSIDAVCLAAYIKKQKHLVAEAVLLDDGEVSRLAGQADSESVCKSTLSWLLGDCIRSPAGIHSDFRLMDFVFRNLNQGVIKKEVGAAVSECFEFEAFMCAVWERQGILLLHVSGLTWFSFILFGWIVVGVKALTSGGLEASNWAHTCELVSWLLLIVASWLQIEAEFTLWRWRKAVTEELTGDRNAGRKAAFEAALAADLSGGCELDEKKLAAATLLPVGCKPHLARMLMIMLQFCWLFFVLVVVEETANLKLFYGTLDCPEPTWNSSAQGSLSEEAWDKGCRHHELTAVVCTDATQYYTCDCAKGTIIDRDGHHDSRRLTAGRQPAKPLGGGGGDRRRLGSAAKAAGPSYERGHEGWFTCAEYRDYGTRRAPESAAYFADFWNYRPDEVNSGPPKFEVGRCPTYTLAQAFSVWVLTVVPLLMATYVTLPDFLSRLTVFEVASRTHHHHHHHGHGLGGYLRDFFLGHGHDTFSEILLSTTTAAAEEGAVFAAVSALLSEEALLLERPGQLERDYARCLEEAVSTNPMGTGLRQLKRFKAAALSPLFSSWSAPADGEGPAAATPEGAAGPRTHRETLTAIFHLMDSDRSGSLSVEELHIGLYALWRARSKDPPLDYSQTLHLMHILKRRCSHRIDLEAFVSLLLPAQGLMEEEDGAGLVRV